MKEKEITLLIGSLRGGGAEKVCVTLANQFISQKFTVRLLVLNLHNAVYQTFLHPDINLINFNIKHARTSFLKIYKYIKENNLITILIFNHELSLVVCILRLFRMINIKIISRNINTLSQGKKLQKSIWHGFVKDLILRYMYNKVDHLIVQSYQMQKDMITYYRFIPRQISVINNPLSPIFEEEAKSSQTYYSTKNNEILFVGRLSQQKGLFYLLNGFRIILKKEQDLKLRIIGQGNLEKKIKNYVSKHKLEKHVIFEGFNSEIISYYKKAKITVLSSIYEGFPNVLLESIAVGTPVVAFDCKSGPSEIIKEGINGFLVPYKDIDQLAISVLKALDHNWNHLMIKKTALRYEASKIVKKYLDVIQNL